VIRRLVNSLRFVCLAGLLVAAPTLVSTAADGSLAITATARSVEAAPSLVAAAAPDWPQWRGPYRDGISRETGLLQTWSEGGPQRLWAVSGIGQGYSSPIVVGDRVYVTGDQDADLSIRAFTLDGQPSWQTTNGASWRNSYPGARSSCAYDDGRLYHLNAHGRLVCLDAATGDEAWAVNVLERYDAENIMWGISESVVVHGDRVFATPAGARGLMVAHDKRTGAPVWATPGLDGEEASYSSPLLLRAGDRTLLVNGGSKYVFAVDAENGELVWHVPQVDPKNTVNTTPVLCGGRLLLTNSSRGFGAAFGLDFDDRSATRVWTSELTISHGGTIGVDGRLFAASSRGAVRGWAMVDAATGTATQVSDLPSGSLIFADSRFYCLTASGTMALLERTEAGFRTTGTFQLAAGKDVWAHPVLCQGRLFLRFRDTLYCYDVRR
jgi:outer membrane protein assembly factor BamB